MYLIKNNQLWVHEVVRPDQPPKIACVVAVTRSSESVAGITKVFTDPNLRNLGCAERLVRAVCN
jgi:predicted GNAT family acetyltransferase